MRTENNKSEVWLRGPLPEVPPLLQPVAHALLQAREEVNDLLRTFPEELLWEKPGGVASIGFHLQHLTGVLNRLLTYARQESLTPEQLAYLAQEGKPQDQHITVESLVQAFEEQVDAALTQLINTPENQLVQIRTVGRAQVPSTLIGLLVHAAEHTTRHLGQLLVTARVLMSMSSK